MHTTTGPVAPSGPAADAPAAPDVAGSEAEQPVAHWHFSRSEPLIVEIEGLRKSLLHGLRLLVEAALVPTMLLAVLLHVAGLPVALGSAVGWCYLTVMIRW